MLCSCEVLGGRGERGKLAYLRVELELDHLADSGCDGVRGERYGATLITDLDYVVFYTSTWSWWRAGYAGLSVREESEGAR